MKKKLIILCTLLICLVFAAPALAAPTVILDGQQLSFDDVQPVIEDGRTLVPLRAIFEAMGAEVLWEQDSRTAVGHKGDTTVLLPIGSTTATINGNPYILDVPAKIVNDRTLAPLRFVAEAFGGTVEWDGTTQTITITSVDGSVSIPGENIYVHYIDVGQGDSIYIELPDDIDILIDGGSRADGPLVVDYLQNQGVDDIELLIATHPDDDHIGGLPDVFDAFVVEQTIDSGYIISSSDTCITFTAKANNEGNDHTDNYQHFSFGNVDFDILTGFTIWGTNANNYSVVCRLDTGDIEFMFMGDAETEVEDVLTGEVEAEILKVGNHGSTSSSSQAFLDKVDPQVAIICVGEGNIYGHPQQETLDKLQSIDALILRTDQDGTIVVSTDGTSYYAINTDAGADSNIQISLAQISDPILPIHIPVPAGNPPPLIPDPSDTSDWVAITDIDLQGDVVTIKNNNSMWTADMTGWYLVSEEGNQTYYFPDEFTLAAGETVYITSGQGAVDQYPTHLKWSSSYIWDDDGDSAKLYNCWGQLVAQWP